MEMEDHHHHRRHQHHQHQQHQHQYGMNDLRQVVNGPRPVHNFPSLPSQPAVELFPGQRNLTPLQATSHHQHQQHYEVIMFGRDIMPRGLHEFDSAAASITIPTPTTAATSASTPPFSGFEAEGAACIGGDASTGRWPRQETLTLLEIRSRLDSKFKEANQKGPLWDEVSRIMSEEHGYQRSGKKCREKFENLYKYYKKTKEGKAGRHDGKHYRFFRQLEALYGENSNTVSVPETHVVSSIHFQTSSHAPSQANQEMFDSHIKNCDSLSLTNSTDFDTSSDDDDDDDVNDHILENESMEKRRKRKSGRSWKVKIKDFIDSQMRKLVEKQKEWLDKLVKTLEEKEKERVLREEEWRKQEASRLEREQKFWAKERAWIEARDAALMEALQKLTGREIMKVEPHHEGINVMANEVQNHSENQNNEDGSEILNSSTNVIIRSADNWPESEITRLQQLRNEMGTRFPRSECSEEVTWEEVATKMACFGYERSALMCKEKWESISNYPMGGDGKEGNKKRKENSRSCFYFKNNIDDHQPSLYNQGSAYCDDINDQRQEIERLQTNDVSSPSNSNVAPADSCFPFLMSTEGGNLWENYGLKLNKANQN